MSLNGHTGVPPTLEPFLFHGVELQLYDISGEDVKGECPFCGSSKFSVHVRTTKFRCFSGSCNAGGNATTFLRKFWESCKESTPLREYEGLCSERGIIGTSVPISWGVVKSITTGEWLVPGYDVEGKLTQLYRYVQTEKRHVLMATKGIGHALHGANLFDPNKPIVYLCEGPWDGMSLYDRLQLFRFSSNNRLERASDVSDSMLSGANVLAVPGSSVFFDRWASLCAGKEVYLLYDNDHPKPNPKTGQMLRPAGTSGMQRAATILARAKDPPSYMGYLNWGSEGYNPNMPDGFDVRDVFSKLRRS